MLPNFVRYLFASVLCCCSVTAFAQTTAFTYQGRLTDATLPATSAYLMEFKLYSAASGGTLIDTLSNVSVTVTNGVFTVSLNFSAATAFDGNPRWLEICVKRPADAAYTTLTPRQPLNSAPYALRALNAGTATNALNVGGTPAANIIKEGDARLTDNRAPTAGSANYVQNTTVQQAASNFNISGNGTAGGTLSGQVVNAGTQYNLGGSRVLSVPAATNTLVGLQTGPAITSGGNNSFVGYNAGRFTTTGVSNSFFGLSAGLANDTGNNNSFFGREAGRDNGSGVTNSFFGVNAGLHNTTGTDNVLLGVQAGNTNTTGSNNTIVGTAANVSAINLTFATALGAGAVVGANNTVVLGRGADAVQIPGSLNVAGAFTANLDGAGITNLNAANIATGTLSNARLGVVPLANGGTGSATQNFVDLTTAQTIGGAKTFSSGLSGSGAGLTNLSAANLTGVVAIANGGTGSATQNFVDLTTAQTIGGDKTFSNTVSGNIVNAATQYNLGGVRALGVSDNGNTYVGRGTGTGGDNNTLVGKDAGGFNASGSNNTLLGASANLAANNLTYATALGAGASVSTSNTMVLGRSQDTVRIPGQLSPTVFGGGTTAHCINGSQIVSLCSSSLRYKTNLAPFRAGLKLVQRLQPLTFDWKDGGMHDLGLGAEDVAAIEPLLVTYNKTGQVEGVKYDRLGVVLLNAVKEQQAQIETQQKQLAAQQAVMAGLRKLVCRRNPRAAACR